MISTIVITWNRLKLNKHFLESYHRTVPRDAGELIVVDNASTDGTKEWLESKYANGEIDKLILNHENYYLGKAFNQGMAKANPRSEYIGKFDNDGYFEDGWYENFQKVKTATKAQIIIVATGKKIRSHPLYKHGNAQWYQIPNDIGGSFYIHHEYIRKYKVRLIEKWWGPKFSGPNPTFFRKAHMQKTKVVRIHPPWVTRKYERYDDPEYKDYYDITFGDREMLDKLEGFHRAAKEDRMWWTE